MLEMNEVILEDGKYRFYMKEHTLYCDRYGEPWRDFCGDSAVWLLFDKCLDLRKELAENRKYLTMKTNEAKLATMGEIIKIIQEAKL